MTCRRDAVAGMTTTTKLPVSLTPVIVFSIALCLMPSAAGAQVVQNQLAGSEWIVPPAESMAPGAQQGRFAFDDKKLRMFVGDLQCDESQTLTPARNEIAELLQKQSGNALAWAADAELEFRQYEIDCHCSAPSKIMGFADKAVGLNPQSAVVQLTAAKIDFFFGDIFSARQHLKAAASNGASSTDIAYIEALAAQYRHDASATIKSLLPIVGKLDQSAEIAKGYEQLGHAYWLLKQPAEAEKMYRQGMAVQSCVASPQISLAEFLLFEKNDLDGARNTLNDIMERLPNSQIKRLLSVVDYYTWAAAKTGKSSGKSNAQDVVSIKQLAQSAYATPEEVFIDAARFPSGRVLIQKLLASSVVHNIDARDSNSNTALITAASGNNQDSAMFLIDKHAAIDAENADGQRALGFFSAYGNVEAVKFLLRHHANPDYRDQLDDSPLTLAIRGGHAEVLQILLQATPAYKTFNLSVPLSLAALVGDKQMVSTLLTNKANVNPAGQHSMPPLIAAILGRNLEIVRLLLDNKASTSTRYNGKLPIDYARATGDDKIIRLLTQLTI